MNVQGEWCSIGYLKSTGWVLQREIHFSHVAIAEKVIYTSGRSCIDRSLLFSRPFVHNGFGRITLFFTLPLKSENCSRTAVGGTTPVDFEFSDNEDGHATTSLASLHD